MTTQADNGVKPNGKPFVRNRVQLAKPQQTAYSGRTAPNSPMMAQVRQARQPQPQQVPYRRGEGLNSETRVDPNAMPLSSWNNRRGALTAAYQGDDPTRQMQASMMGKAMGRSPEPFTPEEQNYLAQLQAQQMVDDIFAKYPGLTGGATR